MNISNLYFSAIDDTHYALTKLNADDSWLIQVADGSSNWSFSLSPNEIDECAKAVSIKTDKYKEDLLDSLSGRADTSYSFFVSISNKKELKITWKRNIKGFANVLGIFNAKLQYDQEQLRLNIFNDLDFHIKQLHQKISTQEKDIQQLKAANDKSVKKCEDAVRQYETIENRLLEKFSAVLNAKKRRIRELEDGSVPAKVKPTDKNNSPESRQPSTSAKSTMDSTNSKSNEMNDSDTDISDPEDIFPKARKVDVRLIKPQQKPKRLTRNSSKSGNKPVSDTPHNADDLIDSM